MAKNKYYWIYILEVKNGRLYTGYTSNLVRRYLEHLKGTAASKYTRAFKIKTLCQCWRIYTSIGNVLKLEHLIKCQTRLKKLSLISSPEDLKILANQIITGRLRLYTFPPREIIRAADECRQTGKKPVDFFSKLAEKNY